MKKVSQILHTQMAELVNCSLTRWVSNLFFVGCVSSSERTDPCSADLNTLIMGPFTGVSKTVCGASDLKNQPTKPQQHCSTWDALDSDTFYSPVKMCDAQLGISLICRSSSKYKAD